MVLGVIYNLRNPYLGLGNGRWYWGGGGGGIRDLIFHNPFLSFKSKNILGDDGKVVLINIMIGIF